MGWEEWQVQRRPKKPPTRKAKTPLARKERNDDASEKISGRPRKKVCLPASQLRGQLLTSDRSKPRRDNVEDSRRVLDGDYTSISGDITASDAATGLDENTDWWSWALAAQNRRVGATPIPG